jgi:prepilin-type N-terminal cleavage/methylation domain-containing protein
MRRGVTLIELVVVLAILGIVASVALPPFRSEIARSPLEVASHDLAERLRGARKLALARQMPVRLTFSPRNGAITMRLAGVSGDSIIRFPLSLPPGVSLERRVTTAVRFDTRGRSSPDTLVLSDGVRVSLIIVDPWTGLPRVVSR